MYEDFSFVNPNDVGLTSVLSKPNLKRLDSIKLDEQLNHLKEKFKDKFNELAEEGKIFVDGTHYNLNFVKSEYEINEDWKLVSERYRRNIYLFRLEPLTISATLKFVLGLQKIAKAYLTNQLDIDIWVRYQHNSKIFYLKEFSEILGEPITIEGLEIYTNLFNEEQYKKWCEVYHWKYPSMTYTMRRYLKYHMSFHQNKLKKIKDKK